MKEESFNDKVWVQDRSAEQAAIKHETFFVAMAQRIDFETVLTEQHPI